MKANLRKLNGNLLDVSHTENPRTTIEPSAASWWLRPIVCQDTIPLPIQNFPQQFRTNYFPLPPTSSLRGERNFHRGFAHRFPAASQRSVTSSSQLRLVRVALTESSTVTIIRGGNSKKPAVRRLAPSKHDSWVRGRVWKLQPIEWGALICCGAEKLAKWWKYRYGKRVKSLWKNRASK